MNLKHIEEVSINRAGRAPYNFVPLPDKVFIPDYEPPDGSKYKKELLNGWIDFNVECLTDIYIRGMWPLDEYANKGAAIKDQTEPFLVAGKPVIPGSALRGMIRTLVEILSSAPLRQMSDERLFMRGVGVGGNPNDDSFETHAEAYHARMEKIKAGYLYAMRDGWYIKPAKNIEGAGKGYLPYELEKIKHPKKYWKREWGYFEVKDVKVLRFERSSRNRKKPRDKGDYKWYSGYLVCSGNMEGKKNQWVVNEESNDKVDIPEWDVEAYKEAGCTQELKRRNFNYTEDGKKGLPCFYVEWKDNDGQKHITFGHTPYFRIPYVNTLKDANPQLKEYEDDKDFAQVLFGTASDKKDGSERRGWRGRVSFEDAFFAEGKDIPYHKEKVRVKVLGTPKPTTYQHYLVQDSDNVKDIHHWDSEDAIIRGYKYYWHRPKAGYKCLSSKHEEKPGDVHTEIQPVFAGSVFKARLRFENLYKEELGALLVALKLPIGCAHKIGMGKPLGLGSIKIRDHEVYLVDREKRYSSFLDDSGRLSSGTERMEDREVDELKDAFANLVSDAQCENVEELWKTERFKELRALLEYDNLPPNWNARTRYLSFGKVRRGEKTYNYNEYIRIRRTKKDGGGKQKRRVLPRPTQVLKGKVPDDPLPPFEGSCES